MIKRFVRPVKFAAVLFVVLCFGDASNIYAVDVNREIHHVNLNEIDIDKDDWITRFVSCPEIWSILYPQLVNDPVHLLTGELYYETVDVAIPGIMPLVINRKYRSDSDYKGMFGCGWNMDSNERLFKMTDGKLMIRYGYTEFYKFTNAPGIANQYLSEVRYQMSLTNNTDGSYTLYTKHGESKEYDENGCLKEYRDLNGNQLKYTYDALGKLPISLVSEYSHVTNPIVIARDYRLTRIETANDDVLSGRYLDLSYNNEGFVTNIADFTGRSWAYAYNERGELLSVITPPVPGHTNGLEKVYTYSDDNQNLLTYSDWSGGVILSNKYEINKGGWHVAEQNWGGSTSYFTPDVQGTNEYGFKLGFSSVSPTKGSVSYGKKIRYVFVSRSGYPDCAMTNSRGISLTQGYDRGLVKTRTEENKGFRPSDSNDWVTTYSYDYGKAVKTQEIRPDGDSTSWEYNDNVSMIKETRGDQVNSYSYENEFNYVKTHTNPLGKVTAYVYDYEEGGETNGRLFRIELPALAGETNVVSFGYNEYGQIAFATNVSGVVTKYTYDTNNYPAEVVAGFGTALAATNSFEYDVRGNLLNATDALGNLYSNNYDNLDRLLSSVDPLGNETEYTLDPNGKVTRIRQDTGDTNHQWQASHFAYNIRKKLTHITNDIGQVTQFSYDSEMNMTNVVDANGISAFMAYDERDLLWKNVDALTNTAEFAYTGNKMLKEFKDALDNVETYAYDGHDQVITNLYPDGTYEQIGYDKMGNITSLLNRAGNTLSYGYDEWDRLTDVVYPGAVTNSFDYNISSMMTSASDSSGTIALEYDLLNRVTSVTNAYGQDVSYGYDRGGNVTNVAYPNGTQITYSNDALNRVTAIMHGTNIVAQYQYDALGRRVQVDIGNGVLRSSYGYDWGNNLTNMNNIVLASSSNIVSFDYLHDNVGNITNLVMDAALYPSTNDYSYDATYKLTQASYSSGYPFATEVYIYDAMGNRTQVSDATSTNTYSVNNLNQYTNVSGEEYTFDSNGNFDTNNTISCSFNDINQLTQVDHTNGTTVTYTYDPLGNRLSEVTPASTNRFVYDGAHVIADYDGSNNLLRTYIYGPGIDNILAMTDHTGSTNTYYYITDHLGSVHAITDENGSIVEQYRYDAWGRVSAYDGSGTPISETQIGNRYLWQGREYSWKTGLYYFRARWYDPVVGRWLSKDPIGIAGGLNQYEFCGNNPVNFTDPMGLDWLDNAANFSAGFADVVSFGLTSAARKQGGYDYVDRSSGMYQGGEWAGVAHGVAMGGAGGLKAAGAKGSGKAFSHWIPDRMLKRSGSKWLRNVFGRSRLNGNYVSKARHALHDPWAYRFMPRAWKAKNPMTSRLFQQWDRIPYFWKGLMAGTGYGIFSRELNDSGCD